MLLNHFTKGVGWKGFYYKYHAYVKIGILL